MDIGSEGYRMSEDELREILQAIVDFQRHTSATLAGLIELLFDPEFGSILKCDKAEFTKRLADMTQGVIADEQLEELSIRSQSRRNASPDHQLLFEDHRLAQDL